MSSSIPPSEPPGPPYPPRNAILGGAPSKTVDVPITSIFLVLFLLGAAAHMAILQANKRTGHKFVISAMLFVFCMARVMTCTMRLVWSSHLTNIRIAIAAQIFVAAGVLLLFIINLVFSHRVLRASYPHWAKSIWLSRAFQIYYVSIVVMLILLIACTVQSFYTLSPSKHRFDLDTQLVGATYFSVAAFLPIPLTILQLVIPKVDVENFGEGGIEAKNSILLFSSVILTLGASFRAGTAYVPRPIADPAWYHSKACFYIFNFTIEITVVALYAILRVDQRFILPNGGSSPRDSLPLVLDDGEKGQVSLPDSGSSEEKVLGGGEENIVKEGQTTPGKPLYYYEIMIHGYGNGTAPWDREMGVGGLEARTKPETTTSPRQKESNMEKDEENVHVGIDMGTEPGYIHSEVVGTILEEEEENAAEPGLNATMKAESAEGEKAASEEKPLVPDTEELTVSSPSLSEPVTEPPFPVPKRGSSKHSVSSTNDPSEPGHRTGEGIPGNGSVVAESGLPNNP